MMRQHHLLVSALLFGWSCSTADTPQVTELSYVGDEAKVRVAAFRFLLSENCAPAHSSSQVCALTYDDGIPTSDIVEQIRRDYPNVRRLQYDLETMEGPWPKDLIVFSVGSVRKLSEHEYVVGAGVQSDWLEGFWCDYSAHKIDGEWVVTGLAAEPNCTIT
jgi:hypothetical protein